MVHHYMAIGNLVYLVRDMVVDFDARMVAATLDAR